MEPGPRSRRARTAAAVGRYPLADVRDCGASWRAHADAPDAVLLDARRSRPHGHDPAAVAAAVATLGEFSGIHRKRGKSSPDTKRAALARLLCFPMRDRLRGAPAARPLGRCLAATQCRSSLAISR